MRKGSNGNNAQMNDMPAGNTANTREKLHFRTAVVTGYPQVAVCTAPLPYVSVAEESANEQESHRWGAGWHLGAAKDRK
ncbi:hypothetical protein GCM10023186_20580 [Hymenobacter koreensis]|uniref:Uncharacterized protein n=1 Tax=Hymenobacter koreensis TaxID=1084523 RepID=A0ABP8IYZ3_9BACT